MSGGETVSLKRIERSMAKVAQVIENHPRGERAWPIFERLERERDERLDRKRRLREAIERGN